MVLMIRIIKNDNNYTTILAMIKNYKLKTIMIIIIILPVQFQILRRYWLPHPPFEKA